MVHQPMKKPQVTKGSYKKFPYFNKKEQTFKTYYNTLLYMATRITASLAAMVRISAHETIPGHSDSTMFLMPSMRSKPIKECILGGAFFSPLRVAVSSSKTDPSHPCSAKRDKTLELEYLSSFGPKISSGVRTKFHEM